MPFSLINKPSVNNSGVSPAYNEILPGWALYNNYYMIIRNENKFRQRNKSKRNLFETDVIRQDIVDLMVRARSMLSKRELASNDSFLDLDAFGTLRDSRSSSFNMLRAIGEESEESESDSPMLIEVKDLYTDSDVSLDWLADNVDQWNRKEHDDGAKQTARYHHLLLLHPPLLPAQAEGPASHCVRRGNDVLDHGSAPHSRVEEHEGVDEKRMINV